MTRLRPAEFPIEIDAGTHNVLPLLHEIRHALAQLLEEGRHTVIDLRSIPLAPGEEAAIEQALGEGEVQATLSALGPSEFRESSYPGVWLVTHYNHDGHIVGKFVEVAVVPSLLESQTEDIAVGLRLLEDRLAEGGGSPTA
jgi:hydrogenase-1 operon protein HyaF